jgi:streptogramin lyase
MRSRLFAVVVALLVLSGCGAGEAAPSAAEGPIVKGGMDETGPYDVVVGWQKPAKNHGDQWTWGVGASVFADTPDRILVLTRGDVPRDPMSNERRRANYVVELDRNGNEIGNWSQWDTMITSPHSIAISPYDPERHVWVVDNTRQQVWKFTNDGKTLVQTWGEPNVVGDGENTFNGVSSIAFLPDGSVLFGDGYDGTRVVKYDAQGDYVMEFGAGGPRPFNRIHAVAVDANRRIIVSDRNNSRVQVFTENGEFIEEWPNTRRPNSIIVDAENDVWLLDGRAGMGRLVKYNSAGVLQDYWGVGGTPCTEVQPEGPQCVEGAMSNPHGMSVDTEGNLYVADYDNNRVLKFVPRPGADPARMVGQPVKLSN